MLALFSLSIITSLFSLSRCSSTGNSSTQSRAGDTLIISPLDIVHGSSPSVVQEVIFTLSEDKRLFTLESTHENRKNYAHLLDKIDELDVSLAGVDLDEAERELILSQSSWIRARISFNDKDEAELFLNFAEAFVAIARNGELIFPENPYENMEAYFEQHGQPQPDRHPSDPLGADEGWEDFSHLIYEVDENDATLMYSRYPIPFMSSENEVRIKIQRGDLVFFMIKTMNSSTKNIVQDNFPSNSFTPPVLYDLLMQLILTSSVDAGYLASFFAQTGFATGSFEVRDLLRFEGFPAAPPNAIAQQQQEQDGLSLVIDVFSYPVGGILVDEDRCQYDSDTFSIQMNPNNKKEEENTFKLTLGDDFDASVFRPGKSAPVTNYPLFPLSSSLSAEERRAISGSIFAQSSSIHHSHVDKLEEGDVIFIHPKSFPDYWKVKTSFMLLSELDELRGGINFCLEKYCNSEPCPLSFLLVHHVSDEVSEDDNQVGVEHTNAHTSPDYPSPSLSERYGSSDAEYENDSASASASEEDPQEHLTSENESGSGSNTSTISPEESDVDDGAAGKKFSSSRGIHRSTSQEY